MRKLDKLDKIFELQKNFDTELEKTRDLSGITINDWVQKEVLAMVAELMEVLNEVNYKWWKNPKEIQMDCLKEEMIDVLHFYVSTCIKLGMDADEVFEVYQKKNQENQNRQKGLSEKPGYAVCDLK